MILNKDEQVIISYPDKTSYAKLENNANIYNTFTYRVNNYDDLWKLGQIIDVLNHKGIFPKEYN